MINQNTNNQFTAIIEQDRGWFVAHCVEIPGAAGRGPTVDAAKESLAEAIVLILQRQAGDAEEVHAPILH